MDNPIITNNVETKSQVTSEETKSKKSRMKILLLFLISLVLLSLSIISYLYVKNGSDFLSIFEKEPEEEFVETESEKEENTVVPGKATITGTLSYPSENLPSMKVCAVNTKDQKETCIQTSEGANNYTLSVEAGTYLIYASDDNIKVYYTLCDTYTNSQENPKCNVNYNENYENGEWYDQNFVCYEDTTCKAAFTPLAITVENEQSLVLEELVQGWYIPCSHDTELCNDPNFDVWSDYIEE